MLSDVEITGDHSVPRLVSFMPSLSCHSLRPSFLCQSFSQVARQVGMKDED